jgi:hypothetical protein
MEDRMNSDDFKMQKICCLLLSLDGPMTGENLTKFTRMGENFSGFTESKYSIILECNQITGKSIDGDDRYDVISEGVNKIAGSMYPNAAEKKQFLWMLETLAWHDGTCTPHQKKLIRALTRQWEVDPAVLLEMEDTAETLLAIESYRRWIKTTSEPSGFGNSIEAELDTNRKDISDNIACTINLG